MEPFTILCATCQSRIRVRSAELVGQLANCPKCNSMILITGPGGASGGAVAGPSVDSTALTKEVLATDSLPAIDDPSMSEYRLAPEEKPPASRGSASDLPPTWQPSETPLLPSEQWTSGDSAKKRQFLMVGFLGFAGSLLAVILFMAFLRWYAAEPELPPVAGENATPPAVAIGAEQADAPPPDASTADGPDAFDGTLARDTTDAVDASAPSDPQPVTAAGEPQQEPDPAVVSDAAAEASYPAAPTEGLSLEPPGLSTGEPAAADDRSNPPESLAPQLRSFADFLTLEFQPSVPEEGIMPSAPPVTAEDLGLAVTLRREALVPPDLAARESVILPGLVITDPQPSLSELLNLWTHLSGVPMVVDFDSFAAADIDRNQLVQLPKLQNQSIRQVANSIANQLGSQLDAKNNQHYVLRAPPDKVASQLPTGLSMTGLVEDAQSAWLNQLLLDFFGVPAEAIEFADGNLRVDRGLVDDSTWFSIIQMTETWRAALGQPAAIEHQHPDQLVTHFVDPASLTQLDHESQLISPQARPVGQVLGQLCNAAGLECWIDWANVGQVGLGPPTTAVVVTHGRPLRRILDNYAQEFSLVVALLDEHSLWLTSPAAYRRQIQTFVVPAEGQTPQWWQQRYSSLTPLAAEGVGRVQAVATPDGRFMILRCCRPALP